MLLVREQELEYTATSFFLLQHCGINIFAGILINHHKDSVTTLMSCLMSVDRRPCEAYACDCRLQTVGGGRQGLHLCSKGVSRPWHCLTLET